MQLQRFDQVQDFWQQTKSYLQQYEAEHNSILGIVETLLQNPEHYQEECYLAVCTSCNSEGIAQSNEICAIAIRTPRYPLILSKVKDFQALPLIAEDLQPIYLPGVSGFLAEAEAFAQAWQRLTGQTYQRHMEMRLYGLSQVAPIARAPGQLRLATERDRALLLQWVQDFESDANFSTTLEVERVVNLGLERQRFHLWEDGSPVSLASSRPISSTSARINLVYTPPEHRGQGYAKTCVAALTQKLLDQSCDRCFLYADLANPISNHIYQQIGYSPIFDWYDYSFKESP
jgi:hypothetical protein